ncbi:unnamed protein product [Durusdinium trenchii]|uniref:Amino acid transporter transmembrane domain-containing protein n=1 Tax=Durusdinium trenchii TaxID=1381693 RepID=A0ABP0I5Z8_9DINO
MAFNISKGIVGEGILSLPAGIAAGTGIVPALVVMTAFCVVMMYSFWSIGRCCEATGGKTHGDVGMAVLERGGRCFGGTMEVINLLKTTMTCAAYALVIGKNSADVWTALEREFPDGLGGDSVAPLPAAGLVQAGNLQFFRPCL